MAVAAAAAAASNGSVMVWFMAVVAAADAARGGGDNSNGGVDRVSGKHRQRSSNNKLSKGNRGGVGATAVDSSLRI